MEIRSVMDLDLANPLAVELRQEMAGAYFTECRKMVAALDALKRFDERTEASMLSQEQASRRAELLAEAAERVFFVAIQREAMKLSGYEELFRGYQIPDEVRARMGPKRAR